MSSLILSLLLAAVAFPAAAQRTISRVEPIEVSCAEGSAPTLPYRLWVTYSDGTSQWRTARWTNASRQTEQQQAALAAGAQYTVDGFIVGDPATTRGYPVAARVTVLPPASLPPVPAAPVARPLPLADVHLTGDNRLTANLRLATEHLLSLPVEQQLYNYRDTYGLPTEGYPVADGWDSPTTKLKGHGTGHYLSALALAYASNDDETVRKQLLQRITRMVDQMRECQERTFVWSDSLGRYYEARDLVPEGQMQQLGGSWDDFDRYKADYRHYGYGYLNAIPPQHAILVEMYRPYNNQQWVWAPYYTIHKQLAGLIDIATLVPDAYASAKALQIATDMGLWVWNRMHYRTFNDASQGRTRPGNRYEMWNIYIAGENGGMGESLAQLAMLSPDTATSARLFEAACAFDNPVFFNSLAHNIDDIRTRHANQHIPQIVGALKIAGAAHALGAQPATSYYYTLSRNFWHMIQGRYRYSTGGVGNGEMFRLPYTQMLSMVTNGVSALDTVANPTLNETCCAYNLAKLTKDLNCYTPNDARLMDYYERVLYNQIVGSLRPDDYATTYHYAVGLNASKPWGNTTPQESCCGGTGSESHVKYQEAAYFVGGDTMWVALYLPTVATWREKGVQLRQQCQWPAQASRIVIERGGRFALKLRVPCWATDRFKATLIHADGSQEELRPSVSAYFTLPCRDWKSGESVQVEMPYGVHMDFAPDKVENQRAADGRLLDPAWATTVMYGPLAMTGTGAADWEQATLRTTTSFDGIDLSCLMPDYQRHTCSTHYYRIEYTDVSPDAVVPDLERLRQAIDMAATRAASPQQWAPYGYSRMDKFYAAGRQLLAAPAPEAAAIERTAAALEAALVAMRPSGLAEPEDLRPLLALISKAEARLRQPSSSSSPSLASSSPSLPSSLDYARMVVRYVSDGSGTPDMISKAIDTLTDSLGQ